MTTEKQFRYKIVESVGTGGSLEFQVFRGETAMDDGLAVGIEHWKQIGVFDDKEDAVDYICAMTL